MSSFHCIIGMCFLELPCFFKIINKSKYKEMEPVQTKLKIAHNGKNDSYR